MNELKGIKVAILLTDGFEQVEMVQPREALEKAGARLSDYTFRHELTCELLCVAR